MHPSVVNIKLTKEHMQILYTYMNDFVLFLEKNRTMYKVQLHFCKAYTHKLQLKYYQIKSKTYNMKLLVYEALLLCEVLQMIAPKNPYVKILFIGIIEVIDKATA